MSLSSHPTSQCTTKWYTVTHPSDTALPPIVSHGGIPAALTSGRRFVGYRLEPRRGQPKPAKMPYSPDAPKGASSTDPSHWVDYETATAYASKAGLDGVMRAFVESDGLVGVDLDHCRDPESGEIAAWAVDIIRRLDTYTELSPSGTGVHLWLYGALPPSGRKRGDVEMYSSARFFTLTGQHLEGTPTTVGYRPDAIAAIHRETFGVASNGGAMPDAPSVPPAAQSVGDDDVIRLAAESPHNGERFRRLWAGDTSDYRRGDNDGASEADAALCELLAHYGGPDRERIERLWLASGLARPKTERADYRRMTIDLVLRDKTRFYGDSIRAAPSAPTPTDPGRVAYLERALLDRDDRIESLLAANATLSIRLTAATAQLIGWKTVLSNPKLKPADRIAALPAIEHVLAARARGQDEIHIRYPGVVKAWGLPESTLGKSMDTLTALEGAPLAKRSEPGPEIVVETKKGPRTVTPRMTIIRSGVEGDLYAAVGSYDPGLPQRGGHREPPPPCPEHPAADYVERTVPQCADCRRPIGPAVERQFTRLHFDGVTDEPAPTVSVRTLRRHFDGVTESIVQPSWLDGWPDPPDLAPVARYYDDVAIAGGET